MPAAGIRPELRPASLNHLPARSCCCPTARCREWRRSTRKCQTAAHSGRQAQRRMQRRRCGVRRRPAAAAAAAGSRGAGARSSSASEQARPSDDGAGGRFQAELGSACGRQAEVCSPRRWNGCSVAESPFIRCCGGALLGSSSWIKQNAEHGTRDALDAPCRLRALTTPPDASGLLRRSAAPLAQARAGPTLANASAVNAW